MKGKVAILRLSPNEEDRIIREEYEKRRKLRLQQVREQQRCIALKIRRAVDQRRQHELEQLGKELKDKWELEQAYKINTLQKLYQENLQLLGQGQRSAKDNEPNWAAIAQKEEENHAKAEERFREALRELKSQKLQEYERQRRSITARKKALETEKERSAKVANLPLPPPNPIQNMDFKKPHRIKMSDVNAFATTYYHMADTIVDREVDQIKPNAHEEAEVELVRLQQMEMEKMRRRAEQLEKAHLRGKQALRREHLEQDCERLLHELEHMQQTDQLRRRQQVAKMPPQIFQPLYKRAETKEDFQRQMEFAFEHMYTEERRVKGDLVVQLVPEPLPELSTDSQDQELDVTLDEVTPPLSENTQPDTEQGAGTSGQESSTQVEHSKRASKHPLKKLLDRVRSQRNQWTEHEAAVDLPTVITDEIPEKDTTIDTGSLTSEEKSDELPVEFHKPTHNGPETLEQPTAADILLSEETSKRNKERKKRDEELEREKLEQLALLQELEVQKAKLEKLLKSQQESTRLHVTHEEDQPQTFISGHEVFSAETAHFTRLPNEDDHAREISEYQRHLLEQNRIHQRYVEVARKRLEEYRKALQMRYKMAAEKVLPPHLCTQPAPAAAGLSRLTKPALQASSHGKAQTSRVMPIKESVPVWEPRPSDTRSVPDVESFLSNTRYQTTDGCVVTERLRDRFKSLSVTKEPHKELPSHLANDPDIIQAICPSIKNISVQAPVHTGALPPDSVHTLSVGPTEDLILRQSEEQQAVVLQRSQQHEMNTWEVDQMRQQKQYLQALIHIDSQTEQLTEATSEERVSQSVCQSRRSLLESLLKAVEQRNGGTLSHLEDHQTDKGEAPIQSGTLPLSPKGQMKGHLLEQREPGELCPEEKEQGWQTEMEFRSQRKEMSQPVPEPAAEQLASEDISQIRRKLFASLLKVIAETNDGTSSQSETAQKEDKTAFNSASSHPEGLGFPLQATRPPITRVKSTVWEMSQQHELSAIPEVETPVNTSLVTSQLHHGQQIFQQSLSSETSSGRSGHLVWAERLLSSSESSPQCSVSVSKITSPLSSDSGRGADYSGPTAPTLRSTAGATCPESDSLSTTTISTGSYVTTDPEQISDKSPALIRVGQEAELLAVFSPPSENICIKDSAAAGSPHLAVERLFSDSGIQRIIDKYTKELNFFLRTPERQTAESGASAADQLARLVVAERNERTESSPVPSDDAAAQGSYLQWASAAGPAQDSFTPLVGQPADQSSCQTADRTDSAIEHLVGQPWAHSSLIGLDHSAWDSTLTLIGRVAYPSMRRWQTGRQGPSDLPTEHLTTWFDGGPEESHMKPLVEELDESSDQQMDGSGLLSVAERTSGSNEVTVPSQPEFPPTVSVLEATPLAQTIPSDRGPGSTEVWDSFHPLMAEVTHNETADPSVNFEQPSSWDPRAPVSFSSDALSESEQSLDFFRVNDAAASVMTPPALHESFPLLITSPDPVHQSVCPLGDMEVMPQSLSTLETCSNAPVVSTTRWQEAVSSSSADKRTCEDAAADSGKIEQLLESQDWAEDKGILEQSQITLVSLTDTSLQDQDATLTDEAGSGGEEHPEEEKESMSPGQPHNKSQTVTLLEVVWGPGGGQNKRNILQRSPQRVKELKSNSDSREQLESGQPQPSQMTVCSGLSLCKIPQDEAPEVDTRICTTEQRKLDLSEMRQRTRRLYQQLEEVQQQKAVRSRREASTQNRLKAKEFHKKTLQKLRAKQPPC